MAVAYLCVHGGMTMLFDEAEEYTQDDTWGDDDPFAEETAADAWQWSTEDDAGW